MNSLCALNKRLLNSGFVSIIVCYALVNMTALVAAKQTSVLDQDVVEECAAAACHEAEVRLVPAVVLSNGKEKKLVPAEEFFAAAAADPNLSQDDLEKIDELKSELGSRVDELKFELESKFDALKSDLQRSVVAKNGQLSVVTRELTKGRSVDRGLAFIAGPAWSVGKDIWEKVVIVTKCFVVIGIVVIVFITSFRIASDTIDHFSGKQQVTVLPSLTPEQLKNANPYFLVKELDGKVYDFTQQLCSRHNWFYDKYLRPAKCPALSEFENK